jgi:predicted transcriptional regulator
MAVMSIRIDDKKRKLLKVIASIEGKPIGAIISELIDDYVSKNKKKLSLLSESAEIKEIMALSKISFSDWDNEEDEIYNDL